MTDAPLQYRISSWDDLVNCKSNNSRDLRIFVTHFINQEILTGTRISVVHNMLGNLFTTVVNGKGNMVSKFEESINPDMSIQDILKELAKYGFLIDYKPSKHLEGTQLQQIITLGSLGFDKIRILPVLSKDIKNQLRVYYCVVVFRSDCSLTVNWTVNTYRCPESRFKEALAKGNALNITQLTLSNSADWSWLEDYVMNIQDILNDNTRC